MRALSALLVSALVAWATLTPAPVVASETTAPAAPAFEPRTPTGEYFRGHPDAPITLDMFGDFQCPACGEFARSIEPPFIVEYVETGKVKLVWHDYAWIGDESLDAAQAARCAGRQGRFWAYHDYLFAHQRGENAGQFAVPNLQAFAVEVGLEPIDFTQCLISGDDWPAIFAARSAAIRQGVAVTPSFLINGDLRVGAPPLNRLSALMEFYLARSTR
jgi:protein-disulfide isomerase